MNHGSLFSGIGGFDLAAEWAGWENIFHCEWNPFGQKVLKHYWPNATSYTDITKTDFSIHRGAINVLTGGFPCQPYSLAGKRKGKEDERHLWPEMLRAIREIHPRWVVGENVFGLVNWSGGLVFHEVQTDLEAAGYEVWPYVLPACAKDAPHRRDRIWFVAYHGSGKRENRTQNNFTTHRKEDRARLDDRLKRQGNIGITTDTSSSRRVQNNEQQRTEKLKHARTGWDGFPTQSPLCSRNDGLSGELVGITFSKHRAESIKAYGNAIVPQVAFEIFKAINKFELL